MELIVSIGADKESWGQAAGVINNGTWEKIILIKNKDALEFPTPEGVEEVVLDTSKPLLALKEDLVNQLKPKLSGFEANLSIASGSGKEHMALISALLAMPIGIRLVAFTKQGVEFIN